MSDIIVLCYSLREPANANAGHANNTFYCNNMKTRRKKTQPKKTVNKLAQSEKELKQSQGKKVGLVVKVKKSKPKARPKSKKAAPAKRKRSTASQAAVKKTHKTTKKEPILTNEEIIILEERVERQKRIIMWSGVSFFMVLIAVFWLYNTSQVFKKASLENSDNNDISFDYWDELSDDLGNTINEMRENIDDIKSLSDTATSTEELGGEKLPVSENLKDVATSSTGTADEISQEEIEALKKRLEELESKIGEGIRE